jgi:hypothetical protein
VRFDFVGPGIDIGFRLGSLSKAQKTMISMDAAFMLASVSWEPQRVSAPIHYKVPIYYDGRIRLKGVFDNRPYPLFWLNNARPGTFEERETDARRPLDPETIKEFCRTFYTDQFSDYTDPPFIREDPINILTEEPEGYAHWLESECKAYWKWRRREEKQAKITSALASPASTVGRAPPIDPNALSGVLTRDINLDDAPTEEIPNRRGKRRPTRK